MTVPLQPSLSDDASRQAWRAMHAELQVQRLMAPAKARTAAELLLLAACLAAALRWAWHADGAWALVAACLALSLLLARFAFLGHDAGHGARIRSARLDRLIGQLSMTLVTGLAFDEWMARHRAHHRFCQDESRDPDMAVDLMVSLTAGSLAAKGPVGRWLTRWQFVHVWALSLLFAHSQRHQSQWGVLRRLRKYPLDAALLLLHLGLWFGLPCLLLGVSFGHALLVYLLPLCLLGPHLAAIFWVNHIGMPQVRRPEDFSFVEHQVLTSRSIIIPPRWRWLWGGLNLQVEHHLFPSVAASRLPAVQAIVQRHLAALPLSYHAVSWPQALRAVAAHLRGVAWQARSSPYLRVTRSP
jgi:fatty acid desaturase